jgi:hypothetical protein
MRRRFRAELVSELAAGLLFSWCDGVVGGQCGDYHHDDDEGCFDYDGANQIQ